MTDVLDDVSGTVAARIREAMGALSAKERLVARAVLAQYPVAGLETTASLAEIANVSVPTVVRFVSKVGYPSYKQFQSRLREELAEKTASPVVLETRSSTSSKDDELVPWASRIIRTSLGNTFEQLPESEVQAAVFALAGAEGSIHTFGGRFTHVLAEYAALNLRAIRQRVYYHRDIQDAIAASVEMSKRDCLIIFDVRRYQPDAVRLARRVKEGRGTIVLITDPWMSPIAEFADIVLPARVEAPSPLDGLVGPMAVVEMIVAGVQLLLGEKAADRLRHWEEATAYVEGRRL
ncbi:MurR/RpiR family transcriptional regulator [Paenarthrobacter ureafaciens]|uniref:MurR/RpiR family transcriptional regulator n=1 Tax=Paenarthrobacter ureafaciens TaxID=37931 RepID=UPI0015BED3EA|nr:MurR/RpiR family transcriptional regulator [Paenarthrobacter ureafaciens]NWL26623.1 MurR/RpiR family transcriptional regulator [Paenarthrobacter ureafaciens]